MSTITEEPELRICTECCEFKPLTEFRKRYKGRDDRMHQCRRCHSSTETKRRRRKKAISQGFRMQAIATAARRPRSMKQLLMLLDFAVVASGGFEKLLRDWHAAVHEAIDRGIPTPRLRGFYEGIISLAFHLRRYGPTQEIVGSSQEPESESGSGR